MAEYIEREALLKKVCAACREYVRNVPAAAVQPIVEGASHDGEQDVAPVVHGRWVLLEECSNAGVYCSACHKKVYKECYANCKPGSNYCPNCGAKMDEWSYATVIEASD